MATPTEVLIQVTEILESLGIPYFDVYIARDEFLQVEDAREIPEKILLDSNA